MGWGGEVPGRGLGLGEDPGGAYFSGVCVGGVIVVQVDELVSLIFKNSI